jgi:SagB-type dehydrogenase family enzyme
MSLRVYDDDHLLAMLVPGIFRLQTQEFSSATLSRFAYLRKEEAEMFLETPLSHARLVIQDSRFLKLLFALQKGCSLEKLSQEIPDLSQNTLKSCLCLLELGSFLTTADVDPALMNWEFHDLLFHSRSRIGRHCYPSGGTFRFLSTVPPSPALHPIMKAPDILFEQPNLEMLKQQDRPFTAVLEARASIRIQGKIPISLQQLGEFLYRTARVKEEILSQYYETTRRPCSGGGACHELELYLLIQNCSGIEKGLYHYDPKAHGLLKRADWSEELAVLLSNARQAMRAPEDPQILIIFSARFARVMWKYQSTAYALILKDVGALMQMMYLVATAMDLAPCAIGSGNSDLFSRIVKTNYYEETSVGEFSLGASSAL